MSDEPAHQKSWKRGAAGEERVARSLSRYTAEHVVLLYRQIPRSKMNIDHIAIGEPCALKFDVGSVSWFDRETGRRIDELDTPARAMEASTAATEARATSVD